MDGAGVSFLLGKLDSLLSQEINLLSDSGRGVEEIRQELDVIRAKLEGVGASPSALPAEAKAGMKQVRDLAHKIEDCVDEFDLLAAPRRAGFLRRTIRGLSTLRERRRIAILVREIRASALEVSERVSRYVSPVNCNGGRTPAVPVRDPRIGAHFIQEAELVGIGGPKRELLRLLGDPRPQLVVVAVVGMGGLGKTTLVKRLYESDELRRDFHCFAWVTVSQSFSARELLTKMARELSIVDGAMVEEYQEADRISRHLQQKKYAVVFDDIWGVDAWEAVRYALPDNQMGSRVMVTTRIERVAAFCSQSSGYVYRLRPLPLEEGRVLFYRKAFRSSCNPENPNPPCPPSLVETADSILKRCGGLPLAVVTIGGLLATKNDDVQEWRKLDQTLGLELESNPCLENIKIILNLSYRDLPSHLKACFLYLSTYPEDYQIKGMQLVRLWVAEGFVQGRLSGKTLEEVAEDYLRDLVDRSMVQVTEVKPAGRVRHCQVHDLVREIVVSRAMEENFAALLHEHNSVVPLPPPGSLRRLAIHEDCPGRENTMEGTSFSNLRSLISFRKPDLPLSQPCPDFLPSMRLLRVLDVGCNTLCREFLSGISQLCHLRYLRLRGRYIEKIPKSLGKLRKLEVLDLKGNNLMLPREVTKLPHLRHLLVNGVGLPRGVDRLKSLQKLKAVDVQRSSRCAMRELGKLSQLRSLSVYNLRREDGLALCNSMETLTCLRSLKVCKVDSSADWLPLDLNCTHPPAPPQELQCLALRGKLQVWPSWVASCRKLVKVVLEGSELTDDPFASLQTLPNLQVLHLLAKAYSGECLHSASAGFSKLKLLRIKELGRLELVKIDEGAMVNLEKLCIEECGRLRTLPLGIECLAMLKELNLYRVSGEFQLQDEDSLRAQHVGHFTVVREDRSCLIIRINNLD